MRTVIRKALARWQIVDTHYWRRQPRSFRLQYEGYKDLLARSHDGAPSTPGDAHYPELQDFAGPDLVISKGLRSTVLPDGGDPLAIRHRVGVLGGSTVFCAEVPDHLTLPSQLAFALRGCGIPAEVVNFGLSGATSRGAIGRFHSYADDGGFDLVVLYLGINDCFSGYRKSDLPGMIKRTPVGVVVRIVRMLREIRRETIRSIARFNSELRLSGGSLIIVLQPSVPTLPKLSWAIAGRQVAGPTWGFFLGLRIGYFCLRRHLRRFENFLDISSLPASADQPLFVDWAHLNATGNLVVAREIAREICREMGYQVRSDDSSSAVQTSFHAPDTSARGGFVTSDKVDPFNYPLF